MHSYPTNFLRYLFYLYTVKYIYKYPINLGKRTPSGIKNKVLDSWLFGIPINIIATCNGIDYGSVFRIIESFKSKIPDRCVKSSCCNDKTRRLESKWRGNGAWFSNFWVLLTWVSDHRQCRINSVYYGQTLPNCRNLSTLSDPIFPNSLLHAL